MFITYQPILSGLFFAVDICMAISFSYSEDYKLRKAKKKITENKFLFYLTGQINIGFLTRGL